MTECKRWSFMLFSRSTLPRIHTVRTQPHPFFPSYLTVNFYACSSPIPALRKIWTFSTGGTQISRFVKFRTPISLFAASSPLVSVRFSHRKSTKHIPTEFKPRINDSFGSFGCAAVPSHSTNFVSSNQPDYEPYPSLTHSCTLPSSAVTLPVSPSFPFRLIWPTSMIG